MGYYDSKVNYSASALKEYDKKQNGSAECPGSY